MSAPLLELRGVSSGYGDLRVLHDVSFTIAAGEVVALMGSNGAGKTTTLRTIVGLLRPMAGTVLLDGKDISRTRPEELVPRGVALCPEGRGMLRDLTVRQNLELGGYTLGRDRGELRRRLDEAFAAYPILRERADQLAGTLSGGQQQMLAIVRAMMSRPRLLLVDEASMGLSPIMAQDTFELIARTSRDTGAAVLLVEQNVEALRLAQRALVLEKGQIVQEAAGAQLEALARRLQDVYLGGVST